LNGDWKCRVGSTGLSIKPEEPPRVTNAVLPTERSGENRYFNSLFIDFNFYVEYVDIGLKGCNAV
jgi:hypothetical protein